MVMHLGSEGPVGESSAFAGAAMPTGAAAISAAATTSFVIVPRKPAVVHPSMYPPKVGIYLL
ncbi:Mycobacterium rhizamassiliense ORFan [Mycobacterium rhizamassiliense]|uniref:Mycobacterium rhizamassiliense ORFan n=1 Tax=Mycobacterium rhizamassiliense TaxID=1841860 RepID=A0A2U3NMA6_9MYCO|nr:Mycobacterium rhizamassiliense ORFan [Mycobacterium rhizamassiliense]